MQSTRQLKVAELIKEELAKVIQQKFNGLVSNRLLTITQVGISPDLSFAKIYVSIFPSTDAEKIILEINHNSTRIRFELGKTIKNNLRIVPEIVFYLDDTLDVVERIDKALKQD
ncbi:MAG: 30S ribosome-binding factor RbfA [Bacteroidales bacterium]|jgi:ribosome-binding factor A|nr:30S ribosome-binding factor RbfA [Bacteroidales bacterium]